jgi:pyrroline-5-carboxylate reductase
MKICFIGGGNMATALIGGLLAQGFKAGDLSVVEINADNRARLTADFGVRSCADLAAGIQGCACIVLAVKPQQLQQLTLQLAPMLTGQLLISIAAGVRASDLARWANSTAIVRAMPNTPALIQSGMTGLFALPNVAAAQRAHAEQILAAVGKTLWLADEVMLDSVTAISGSGPAYVFYLIEAMQAAAIELGFNAAEARLLSQETFLGAAKLALASDDDVAILRQRVTSKNGTTERALLSLEANHVKQHIISAAHAAAARSREMGDELGVAT